jgi:hypothetical protein
VVRDAVERLLQAPREMQALSLVCVCVCCAAWRVDRVPAPRNPAERAPLCAEVDPRDRGEAVGEGLACTCQRSAVACEAQGAAGTIPRWWCFKGIAPSASDDPRPVADRRGGSWAAATLVRVAEAEEHG